jgi:hypothetical protein
MAKKKKTFVEQAPEEETPRAGGYDTNQDDFGPQPDDEDQIEDPDYQGEDTPDPEDEDPSARPGGENNPNYKKTTGL